MFYQNIIPLVITLLLFPQVAVHGGLVRELSRKIVELFKWSKPRHEAIFYEECDLCTFGPCTPMVLSTNNGNLDGTADAEGIKQALDNTAVDKGNINSLLTDEHIKTVTKILTQRTAPQRAAIAQDFNKMYGKNIRDQLKEKVAIDWRYYILMRSLSLSQTKFYEEQFQNVINFLKQPYDPLDKVEEGFFKKLGQTLIEELLTTLPKCMIDKAIEFYNTNFPSGLINDLDKALRDAGKPTEYIDVIKKLVEHKRDQNKNASWLKALTAAYKLKSAVISNQDTEMKLRFSELFTERSHIQIIETMRVYENLRHGDKGFISLFDDIDKYKGGEKEVYKTMVRLLSNKPLYYAETMESIFKSGIVYKQYGKRLIHMIVGRYDIDLKDIIDAYNRQSKTGFRADFEAWDVSPLAVGFHPIMLGIIEKASKTCTKCPA